MVEPVETESITPSPAVLQVGGCQATQEPTIRGHLPGLESKVLANYRLCRVMKAEPSADGCVCTVSISYLPRKQLRQTAYY